MGKVVIKILQGSVVTQTVLGGLTIYLLVANFPQCICAKNYGNWLAVDKVMAKIIWLTFFWPTLYSKSLCGADDCSAGACDVIRCENEAKCAVVDADRAACMCPLGTAGVNCQSSKQTVNSYAALIRYFCD